MKEWKGYVKGVNLGGWFSQCSHEEAHYDTFILEEDIATIASWGMDHVRVPVDYNLVETPDGEYREEGFERIGKALEWCGRHGLNMILDLHKTYGYSFDKGEGEKGFFEVDEYQDRFYRLWEQFAERFGNTGERLAFELLNEVTLQSYCETWNRIADTCIARIRNIAPNVKILVGGYWNNSVSAVKDIHLTDYQDIILNFHCYEPLIFTHQGAGWVDTMPLDFRIGFPKSYSEYASEIEKVVPETLSEFLKYSGMTEMIDGEYFEKMFAEAVKVAEATGVPLYCGEYGVIDRADIESTLRWYKTVHSVLEKHGIGRAAWSYKQMDFGISGERLAEVFEELKKYL